MSTAGEADAMDLTADYPATPCLALDDGEQNSNYDACPQHWEAEYMAEDSSASASTNNLGFTPPGLSPLGPGASAGTDTITGSDALVRATSEVQRQKQRLERRGHTKSRRGCFNCKRRRIKCQETTPACGHCVKTGLICEYPTPPPAIHMHQIPLFSLQDMRLFQHFLMHCYPHHPIGAGSLWTHEIPCLSEKHEYLMHAILGLAASDLSSAQRQPGLVASAMDHRVKAIKAIKKTLSDARRADTFEEGDALMATCFALTFQSVLLDDGMAEYMTFIRGVVIVATQMYVTGANLLFGQFLGGAKQAEVLRPLLERVPLVEHAWAAEAVAAVEGLEPLCRHPVERQYHERILEMARQLQVSSWGAYKAMSQHYGWWMVLPHEQFRHVIDQDNQVCVLLAAHWIALKQIMAGITATERRASGEAAKKSRGDMEIGIVRWLRYLNGLVDAEHVVYNRWPMWVQAQLDRDPGFFGKTS